MASSLQIGRLVLGPPWNWHEPIGDPVTNLGGAPIPAPRQALRHEVTIATVAADGQSDSLADRLRIRRGLRSMFNNTPLKLQGYFYIIYSDDPDQNGWYVPDFGTLNDIDSSVGLASGVWKLEQVAWLLAGNKRTNREARNIWMKDLRTGLNYRDPLRMIYSADFSALPAIQTTIIPHGATSITNTVSGAVAVPITMPAGRDGGICKLVLNQVDIACLAYDRLDSAWGLSDVIVYDRRGQLTAPSSGPDTLWEEAYGPSHQWNWFAATPGAIDVPVLDNGLCRTRYNVSAGNPGFSVDIWNGASYVEQGKLVFRRYGDSTGDLDTWVSSTLKDYTFDRAVVQVVLANSADLSSREIIYLTMSRGQIGVTVNAYAALKADGVTNANVEIIWTPIAADANISGFKVDSQTQPPPTPNGKNNATAGTGSALWVAGVVGNANFSSSENWLALLRCSAVQTITPYQANLAVLSTTITNRVDTSSSAYGVTRNIVGFRSNSISWAYLDLSFVNTVADQIMEAESMTLGTGTSSTADGGASNGNAATATRTTDANPHVSKATWPNTNFGVYRIFVRYKVSANSASIFAKTGATTGTTRTVLNSTSYVWVDLGEITANNTTLEIHGWMSGGAGTLSIDRVEAVLTQDKTRTNAIYMGARDRGQAALMDSRQMGAVVTR